MSYALASDFKTRLGKVYDSIYTDESYALDDLTAASADVDSYLAARYVVPVIQPAALPLLKNWTLTLAEELAYLRAGGSSVPEKVTKRVEMYRKQLSDVAAGKLKLPAAPAEAENSAGAAAIVEGNSPVFTRENLGGY